VYLTALSLTNFRNYRNESLSLSPGLTIFTGPNGAGKSNILEAIHCLATGRSFRARSEAEMRSISPDPERPYTRVAATVAAGDQETALEVIWAAEREKDSDFSKRIRVGGVARRASTLLQHLHVVLFTPHDIALVDGSPSTRRRYFDYLLSRLDPQYLRTLQSYENVMAERNALLRALREGKTRDRRQLEAWNHKLTNLGAPLIALRAAYAAHVAEPLASRFATLTGTNTELRLRYESTAPLPETPGNLTEMRISALPEAWVKEIQAAIDRALAEQAAREQAQAVTVVGPHRDDVAFLLGGHPLAAFGSRGEQRLAALTLKLTEVAVLHAETGEWPVILLDDFLSELDAQRRHHVLASLAPNVQAFATTSDLQQFTQDVVGSANVLYVANDAIAPATP
jgi:DNA replication and repair protein RecF